MFAYIIKLENPINNDNQCTVFIEFRVNGKRNKYGKRRVMSIV